MVGLIILSAGWAGVVGWAIYDELQVWKSTAIYYAAVTAVLIWLVSEYFIRRRRMVGPAILLSVMFAGNAAFGFVQQYAQVFMLVQEDFSSLIFPGLLTVGAVFLFWLRFKVPFAMALIALGLFGTALLAAATRSGTPEDITDIFVFSAESSFAWITILLGLVTFFAAMYFDGSDPYRVTRRSAQGFWLHLIAAPMIINTVALSLLSEESRGGLCRLVGFDGDLCPDCRCHRPTQLSSGGDRLCGDGRPDLAACLRKRGRCFSGAWPGSVSGFAGRVLGPHPGGVAGGTAAWRNEAVLAASILDRLLGSAAPWGLLAASEKVHWTFSGYQPARWNALRPAVPQFKGAIPKGTSAARHQTIAVS